jgi:hypothetical protein
VEACCRRCTCGCVGAAHHPLRGGVWSGHIEANRPMGPKKTPKKAKAPPVCAPIPPLVANVQQAVRRARRPPPLGSPPRCEATVCAGAAVGMARITMRNRWRGGCDVLALHGAAPEESGPRAAGVSSRLHRMRRICDMRCSRPFDCRCVTPETTRRGPRVITLGDRRRRDVMYTDGDDGCGDAGGTRRWRRWMWTMRPWTRPL